MPQVGLGLRNPQRPSLRPESSYSLLPQYLITNWGTLKHDFESLTGWTSQAGSQALDTTYFKTGSNGLKITPVAGGAGRSQLDLGASSSSHWDFSSVDNFSLWFYLSDNTNVSSAPRLYFYDNSGAKSADRIFYRKTGWNLVRWKKADMTLSGGFSWSEKIRFMRLQHSVSSGQAYITWDSFYAGAITQPAIIISFDDDSETTYTNAFPAMQAHNIPGTFYVVTNNIGASPKISSAQLRYLQSAGWVIGNHTDNHFDMATGTYAEDVTHLQAADTALNAIEISSPKRLHVAYPGGAYDDDAISACVNTGMRTARTTNYTAATVINQWYMPFTRLHDLPLYWYSQDSVALATAQTRIDEIITKGICGGLLFHDIQDTPTTYGWQTSKFISLMEYIGSKKMPCITIDQAYQLQSNAIKGSISK